MQKRFADTMNELWGLIDDSRSASLSSSSSFPPRSGILLAVSGGIDSMCLADLWLHCFGSESFAIAHCNFHLRGEESDGDESLVAKWAEENGVSLHRVDFDTPAYASENGISIEMAARELRYRWFGDLCRDYGYAAVAVAHHADDNAETLVLNMLRGAGLKGLTGMKPVAPLPFQAGEASREICLLRPLLTFTRKQIEGYVFARKVPYREDSTNASVEYRRNRIRHELFPIFERMNPSYVRTLNREMTYLSDASSIVEEWCRSQLPKVLVPTSSRAGEASGEISISIPSLLEIPQWRYLLYHILEPYGFNSSVLESLEHLLTSDRTISGKSFESVGYVLRTERDSLVVLRKTSPLSSLSPELRRPGRLLANEAGSEIYIPIRIPGACHINGRRILVEVIPWTPDMPLKQPEGTLILDADKLKFPFVCRVWRNGDWMIPLGMRGKKKLSDMFTDLKYSHLDKGNALVLVDCVGDRAEKQHVAALLGVRIDDHYKVSDKTTSIIRITL